MDNYKINFINALEQGVNKEDVLILFLFRVVFMYTVGTGLKIIKTSLCLSSELRLAYGYKNMSSKDKNFFIVMDYLRDSLRGVIAKEFMPFRIKEIKNERKRIGWIEFDLKVNEQS